MMATTEDRRFRVTTVDCEEEAWRWSHVVAGAAATDGGGGDRGEQLCERC